MDTIQFIKKAKEVHGDKYDYSSVIYKNCDTKIKIICIKCNNNFEQIPYNHIKKDQDVLNVIFHKKKKIL